MLRERLTGGSLRDRALAAYQADRDAREREQADRDARDRGDAVVRLERTVREVLGDDALVVDVSLHRDADEDWFAEGLVEGTPTRLGPYGLSMRFPCVRCGLTRVTGPDVTSLEALGSFLAGREAGERHATVCASCWTAERAAEREAREARETATSAPTIEARLIGVLQEFIAHACAEGNGP